MELPRGASMTEQQMEYEIKCLKERVKALEDARPDRKGPKPYYPRPDPYDCGNPETSLKALMNKPKSSCGLKGGRITKGG